MHGIKIMAWKYKDVCKLIWMNLQGGMFLWEAGSIEANEEKTRTG